MTGTTGQGMFNPQQQQQSQQAALMQNLKAELTVSAVKSPGYFPDERDRIVTKLNMIQASAGMGMGVVNCGGQTHKVDFSGSDNLLCRFKVCVCVYVCVCVCTRLHAYHSKFITFIGFCAVSYSFFLPDHLLQSSAVSTERGWLGGTAVQQEAFSAAD